LAASTNPIERIGSAYGLVCLGESKWLGEILAALDHASDDVRHAAAIGLEHLPQPLEDAVYARHLSDMNILVRLRLTRKLGSQGTDNPALVDALIARLEDNEEAIRSAAINAVAALGAEGIYDRMVMLAQSENPTLRACAYQVLGKRSDPRAIPLLIQAIQEDSTPGARKAAISALGDLGAVTAVEEIGAYLDDEELSDAAFWALLSIGMKDSETVKEVLNRRPYQKKRPFLQKLLDGDKAKQKRLSLLALLGDGMAKMQIQGMLSPYGDMGSLLSIIDYVRIVADPDFEDPLRKLLDHKDPQRFPGDRYISYMAFKVLVRTLLAKG
jgi:HEAT repeat protein